MTTTHSAHRGWFRGTGFALLLAVAQGLVLGTSAGEEGDGSAAPPAGTGAEATPAAALTLLESAACDRCAPERTELELVFSAAVDPELLVAALETTPAVSLVPAAKGARRRVKLTGPFEPATTYSVKVPRGFTASGGAVLGVDATVTLTTGGGYPQVRMPVHHTSLPPGGKVPLRFQHVNVATVSLVSLREAEIASAMAISGAHYWDRSPLGELPAALRARVKQLTIEPAKLPTPDETEIDPFAIVGGEQVLVVLEAPGANAKAAVYQRAEVGVLTKLGTDDGVVWVTSTATGKPVPSASVAMYHGDRLTFTGSTDASGLVRVPGRKRLRQSNVAGGLYAVVQAAGHTTVTGADWTDDLEPWMFDLPYYYYSGQEALRGMVTVERGIYRPGEPVNVLGVLRQRLANGRLAPPVGAALVTVKDPDGAQLFQKNVHLTAFGTLQTRFVVPPGGTLGTYHVELVKDGVSLYHSFDVGEFRAATFEIDLPQAGAAEIEAEEIVVPVEAKYLYGAPVAGGKAEYQVSVRDRGVYFPGYEDYAFRSEDYYYYSYPTEITRGEVELDEHGRTVLRIPLSSLPEPTADTSPAVEVIVEATVKDAADDAITARTVQRIERADAFVGIASDYWVVTPKQGWNVDVVTLSGSGKPVAGQPLEVELERTYYNSVAEEGPQGVRYRTEREEVIVETRTVVSEARPSTLHFDLPGGGDYELRVRRPGAPYVASRSVWAYGEDNLGPALNDPRITLKLDKDTYRPGDKAVAHAAIPYAQSTALLTVERSGVLMSRVVELGSTEAALDLDITEAYLPNAFVGLAVVPRSTTPAFPVAGYPFRAGYTELRVSPEERRLAVYVEPEQEKLEPGRTARVRVKVRDQHEQPVRAEVTLWAADEGVLMLTGYKTPDPFQPAYAPYELDVASATNLSRWTQYDPDQWLDGGGDSAPEASALRSRFLFTAHFARPVVTDAKGEALVTFTLPDNVTRWRVMAVAADAGQRFGKGESSIAAAKPLQILPSLPRFLTEGDLVDAGMVVHNQTGQKVAAKVTLDVTGAKLLGAREVIVDVENGRQEPVVLPMMVAEAGDVTLRARVTAPGYEDGFSVVLPAERSTAVSSSVIGEGALVRNVTHVVEVPDNARPGSASLEVLVAPSLLASLWPGVEALLEYPYGCAEQKTSRLIPMAALGDLINQLEVQGFDLEQHRARLQTTIAELEKHQNDDGGFGLWVESESDPWVTAYVLFGWTVASQHGYRVAESRVERGIWYLREAIRGGGVGQGYFGYAGDALAAYVFARRGAEDEGLATKLFEGRKSLDAFDLGLLAATLATRGASGDSVSGSRAREVLAELEGSRQASGSTALIAGGEAGWYDYGSDVRATSMLVEALVAARRATDAASYVRGVLARRSGDGTWGTTYNNLWALMALADYAKAEQASRASGTVAVKLDGVTLGELTVAPDDLVEKLVIPAARLGSPGSSQTLVLESSSGDALEHVVRLEYAPTPAGQPTLRQGYELEREIVDARTGLAVTTPTVGQLLRVRLTVKQAGYRNQVALTDRLPAGFEALNANLQTSQQAVAAAGNYQWESTEVRDDRVSFFAYGLGAGTATVEYLARASRSGEFVWPAATVESMYVPTERARTAIDQVIVAR